MQPDMLFNRLATVLVALGGTVSLIISGGQFSLWTTIVGITLFLVLHTYGRSVSVSRSERLTFAAVWSLCMLLAIGWFLSLLLSGSNLAAWAVIVGSLIIRPFALNTFVFICWLIAFFIVSRTELGKLVHP